jgi:hypothetical protein
MNNRLIELSNADNEAQNSLQTIKKWLVKVHYQKVQKPKGNQGGARSCAKGVPLKHIIRAKVTQAKKAQNPETKPPDAHLCKLYMKYR